MYLAGEQYAGAIRPPRAASKPAPDASSADKPAKRHRIALLVASLVVLAAGIVILVAIPSAHGIYVFGLYAIPSNSLLMVPHEPGLLYFAQFHDPAWLALAGSLGAGAAAFTDYYFVNRAMRIPRIERLRTTKTYDWAVKWLMRRPFATIVAFAALPLPITVIRILGPSSGYPLRRYVIAMMIGRFPRFFVVAWIGYALAIPSWAAIALFAVIVVALVTASWIRNRRVPPASNQ